MKHLVPGTSFRVVAKTKKHPPGNLKPLVLAVSAIAGILPFHGALAQTTVVSTSVGSATLSSSNGNYTSFSITSTGTISGSQYGINASNTIGTLDNAGTIRGFEALYSTGTMGTVINSGTIISTGDAAFWMNGGTITSIANSGSISGDVGLVVQNGSNLGTLTNTGTISADYALANFSGHGGIGSITNSGLISGNTYAVYNATGTFGTFNNSGTIQGDVYSASGMNVVGGSGSLFGTLTGYAANSQGTITITSGNLTFASGNTLLNDHVRLTSGTVSNQAAVLQVNNNLTITGNYQQGSGATLQIGVGNNAVATGNASTDSGYGRLTVSGTAVIASGSSISLVPTGSYAFAQGQRYVVLQAPTSGANYNASSLNYSAFGYSGAVSGSVVVDGSNSNLLLTLGSTTSGSTTPSSSPNVAATTPNAVSAISGLFNYTGANTSLLNVFNASAALGSTAEANRAGAQLSPASNATAASQIASAPTQTALNMVAARVDGVRIAQQEGESGVSTGEYGDRAAAWGQLFGGKAQQSERDNVSGYNADYNGVLAGADLQLNAAWRVGGLVSYSTASTASSGANSGSSVHLTSYGLIGYAGYAADTWYLDVSGGAAWHQYNTTRNISFTGFSGVANGSYNGTQYVVSAQGGYPIKLDGAMAGAILTPIAGLNYSVLNQDGYTESGGNGAALKTQANTSSSMKSDLGAKLERSWSTSYGNFAPSVQLGWLHEYQNTRLQTVASYAADTTGTTSFVTSGATPVADTGVITLGLTLTRSKNLTMTARYRYEGGSGYTAQTGDLRLRYQF